LVHGVIAVGKLRRNLRDAGPWVRMRLRRESSGNARKAGIGM
jgi:hypothetical protein